MVKTENRTSNKLKVIIIEKETPVQIHNKQNSTEKHRQFYHERFIMQYPAKPKAQIRLKIYQPASYLYSQE